MRARRPSDRAGRTGGWTGEGADPERNQAPRPSDRGSRRWAHPLAERSFSSCQRADGLALHPKSAPRFHVGSSGRRPLIAASSTEMGPRTFRTGSSKYPMISSTRWADPRPSDRCSAKTGRPVQFELLTNLQTSLLAWLERRGGTLGNYLFPSRISPTDHLSTRQYARLVNEWVSGVGLRREEYGTHSLRRTKASIIDKAAGNLRVVQILLGHTKIENTARYLGVDLEDALTLAEST